MDTLVTIGMREGTDLNIAFENYPGWTKEVARGIREADYLGDALVAEYSALIIESLLGLNLEGDVLRLAPCVPADWPGYVVRYRYRETVYRIDVRQTTEPGDEAGLSVDGVRQEALSIPLRDDHATHLVEVRLPLVGV